MTVALSPRSGLGYRRVTPDFVQRTQAARKVLVILYGGLGDLVHSLPALWSIRCAYPQARLEVLANHRYTAFFKLVPWIDGHLAYDTRQAGLTWSEWRLLRRLRRAGYELTINLTGNNHGCLLAYATGARWRLGRRAYYDRKVGWRLLQTEVMDFRYAHEPMYQQWLECLAQAGFSRAAEFRIELPAQALADTGVTAADAGSYVHVSPCKSFDAGQLKLGQMVELLEGLHARWPQYRLVLSASDSARERAQMDALVARLSFVPWRVYCGALDTVRLCAVIRGAALHLSPDTGPLHIAWMFGVPTVSWFLARFDTLEYLPSPPLHRAFVFERFAEDGLEGVDPQALLDAAEELLRERGARAPDEPPHPPQAAPVRLVCSG
jgi:ADP-heptose:LPS heptosyltransferase